MTESLPLLAHTAYLGWSNKRGGTEIYPDHAGRFRDRSKATDMGGKGWGDLLTWRLEDEGFSEGTPLVVVAIGGVTQEDGRVVGGRYLSDDALAAARDAAVDAVRDVLARVVEVE